MMLALARVPIARLVRTRRGLGSVLFFVVLAILAAFLARSGGHTSGADRVMRGTFGVLVLPLLTFGIVGAALGGAGMQRGIRGLVVLGASPRRAALASASIATAASVIVCAVLAAIVCAIAHGATDPPLVKDIPASMFTAALGAAAYAAYFSAGSSIGKGVWRAIFLGLDWVVGEGGGIGAVLTPRGHVMSLLGGPLCADLPRLASTIALVVLFGAFLGLTALLARR